MKRYKLWLDQKFFSIVGFYPYTSSVTMRILEQSHNYKTDEHDDVQFFCDEIKQRLLKEHEDVTWGNKVVVELKQIDNNFIHEPFSKNSNIFIGWYDGRWSVGLGVWQPDKWTQKLNKTF